jgi:hypothetical protein
MAKRDISGFAGDLSLVEYDAVVGREVLMSRTTLFMLRGLTLKLKAPRSLETDQLADDTAS